MCPGATPLRNQVAALHERGQRLAERRARDPELPGEVALGRQAAAGRQQAEAYGGAKSLHRLLERGRRTHRLEHRLRGGVALHRPKVQRRVQTLCRAW